MKASQDAGTKGEKPLQAIASGFFYFGPCIAQRFSHLRKRPCGEQERQNERSEIKSRPPRII